MFVALQSSQLARAIGGAPGGVTGATLWLRADAGTNCTTNGCAVTSWQDQSGSGKNASATGSPTLKTNGINFNPTVVTGSGAFFSGTSLDGTGTFSNANFYFVSNKTAIGNGSPDFHQQGTDASTYRLGIYQPFGDSIVYWDAGSTSATQRLSVPAGTITLNKFELKTYNASTTTGQTIPGINQAILKDGKVVTSDVNYSSFTGQNFPYHVGGTSVADTSTEEFSDVIAYLKPLTANEQQRIHSYLAIRNGITLDQTIATDYLDSASGVIWDATANTSYKTDIAGIGRDDASELNQKQSASSNTGNVVTIGHGDIAATNAANTNNFSADKSFLVWGHNNGPTTQANKIGGSSLTRLSRGWKVQETGSVGAVKIRVPASLLKGSNPVLVRSADATFTSDDDLIPLTVNGTNLEATIDLNNGDNFTFASLIAAPGGVVNGLRTWQKADGGTVTGASWPDSSGNGNTASQATAGLQPAAITGSNVNAINYNPGLRFDGVDDRMDYANNLGANGTNPFTFFHVSSRLSNNTVDAYLSQPGVETNDMVWSISAAGTPAVGATNVGSVGATGSYPGANIPRIAALTRGNGGANNFSFYMNGGFSNTASLAVTFNNDFIRIGARDNTIPEMPHTVTSEVITYTRTLSAIELQQVNSYASMKYGTSLDQTTAQDYLASDGVIVPWDASDSGAYKNDITVIGRDDGSALNQKQSQPAAPTGMVAISHGTSAADNASNTNSFTNDKQFLAISDNGAAAGLTATDSPAGYSRLQREWRVEENNGDVGNVQLLVDRGKLPSAVAAPVLLVDADGDFTSGATIVPLTQSGTNWQATVNLADDSYFTFASPPIACDTTTNLITNGTFATDLSGWDRQGNIGYGSGVVVFNGGNLTPNGVFSQTIQTIPGRAYKLSYSVTRGGGGAGTMRLLAAAKDGLTSATLTSKTTTASATAGTVVSDSITFTASSESTVISYTDTSTATDSVDIYLDNVTATTTVCQAPGGVFGEALWLKADDGLQVNASNQVQQWNDKSGNEFVTGQARASTTDTGAIAVSNDILRVPGSVNFNPSVDFSGAAGKTLKGNASANWNTSPDLNIFSVATPEGTPGDVLSGIFTTNGGWATSATGRGLLYYSNATYNLDGSGCGTAATVSSTAGFHIARGTYVANNNLGGSTWLDGRQEKVGTSCGVGADGNLFEIGGRTSQSLTNRVFNGKIPEVIVYRKALTATQAQQVDSYLGIKYGITLNQTSPLNYLASDGTTKVWDATANATYKHRITGIGRDDVSVLNQKQSKSIHTGGLVTIGNGNTIATDNAANTNNFSADKSFLMFGDDNGALTWTATGAPTDRFRMGRIFKAATTGTVGSVKVQAPDNSSSLATRLSGERGLVYLLTDADGDFSFGATEIPMTLNGTNWEANTTLGNQYFTFATEIPPAPDMTPATDSGVSNADDITNDTTPTFTGTCIDGEAVTLIINGTAVAPVQVCSSGSYMITPTTAIPNGNHTVASQFSSGLVSATLPFTIDTTAPVAPDVPDMTAATDTGISSSDNITKNPRPDFTGSCTIGESITLLIDGAPIGTQLCSGGTYTIAPLSNLAEGNHVVTVTSTDIAGNVSAQSSGLTIVIDTIAPPAPVIASPTSGSVTNDTTPTVTGTGEDGAAVTVTDENNVALCSAVVSGGSWSCTPTVPQTEGNHTYKATQTDVAGNTSPQSSLVNVTIDTTPPAAPAAPDMTPATDTGSSNTDNITRDTTPDFTGVCTNGETVTLSIDGVAITPTALCAGGVYLITPASPIAHGDHTITATVTDQAGNVSPQSPSLPFTIDTALPAIPAAPDMTSATDTGSSNADNITKNNLPDFTGSCTNGDTVTLLIDGGAVGSQVCSGGTYTISAGTSLSDGAHEVTVQLTDVAGNTSAQSSGLNITIDTVAPPAPAITSPANNTNTNDSTPAVSGTGENGATVTVTDENGATLCTAVVSGGVWSCTPSSAIPDGPHTLRATQTDVAGNTSSPSNQVDIKIDTAIPAAPVVTTPANGSTTNDATPTFTGTAEPNTTVHLIIDGGAPISLTSDASGNWTYTPSGDMTSGDHTVYATQTDAAGNTSPASNTNTFTIDTTAPGVTVNQKVDQPDPTASNSIKFTIVFDKPIDPSTFSPSDLTIGTAPSSTSTYIAAFTQLNATTWEVEVKGMANGTTVTASLDAGKVKDSAGNDNTASTSTDNSVLYEVPPPNIVPQITNDNTPTLTGQCAPGHDLTIGLSGPENHSYTGVVCDSSGTWSLVVPDTLPDGSYNITVNDTTGSIINPVDNQTDALTIDTAAPSVTVNQKTGQPDPTNIDSAAFTVVFSEPMQAATVTADDFTIAGTTGTVTSFTQINTTTWEVTVTGMTSGDTVTVSLLANKATDTAGNGNTTSTSTDNSVTYDNTPPNPPVITGPADWTVTNDNTPTVNGTGENGATVTVTDELNNVVCTAVMSGGNWTCTPTTPLADGPHTFKATQEDATGNVSVESNWVNITIDTVAPSITAAPDMTPTTDTGASSTDNITSDTTPDFTGSCTPGDTVKLYSDGTQVGSQTCPPSGTYVITATTLTAGGHVITATFTDPAGNTSSPSPALNITILTTAPAALSAPDMTAATDTGASNTDNITSNPTPTFTGTCTSGDTITLYLNGATIAPTQVCSGGTYTITPTAPIASGTHSLTVTATNVAGVTSPQSPALPFTIDTTMPSTPATPDMTAATDSGVSNTDNITKDTTPDFTGACTPGMTVKLYIDGPFAISQPCTTGTYTVTIPAQTNGVHTITVSQVSAAGIESPQSPALSFTIDTVAPPAPAITTPADGSSISDTTPTISGTGEIGATVTVTDEKGNIVCTAVVGIGGNWSCTATTALAEGPHSFTAAQSDVAGNVSPQSAPTSVIIDTAAPAVTIGRAAGQAAITNVNSADFTVTFTEPINPATLTASDFVIAGSTGTVANVIQNSPTTWTVTISGMTDGDTAVMTLPAGAVQDVSGNGNTASTGTTNQVTYDTTAPAAPAITGPAAGATTKDNTPTITGTGEPGAKVTVKVDDASITCSEGNPITVGSDGKWTCTPTTPLADGLRTITATQTDAAGNTSPPSNAVTVTIATTPPPAPVITGPADNSELTDTTPTVTGTGEAGATVTVRDEHGNVLCKTTVDSAGNWSCDSAPLPEGKHKLIATQTDTVGNVSVDSPALHVAVAVDTDTAPAAVEDGAPNGGDGNDDGILDSEQGNVTSIPNPITGGYTTLEIIGNSCPLTRHFTTVAQSSLPKSDDGRTYPIGLFDYSFDCYTAGEQATVKIFLNKLYDTSVWEWRKYNSVTQQFSTMQPIVGYAAPTIGTTAVTTVTYTVVEGGELDEDAAANGTFTDPNGPTLSNPLAPTGQAIGVIILGALLLIGSGVGFIGSKTLQNRRNYRINGGK
ncbi:MAG TPA: Ig-like domain-containing protein [Verrucomicrobiae bacterium]|nr:Ig-like domain-containing protein [Verrucomicrobiae bacterium]